MGFYVDRGLHSCETITLLLLLKLKYPDRITLLRSNHEDREITRVYGFYDQVIRHYGNANPWKYFCDVFDYLGIAAIIEGKIFCVHGGLSPEVITLDQINLIDRRSDGLREGAMCDLLWSDPEDIETWAASPRGAGWLFGSVVTSTFNRINGLDLIVRSHQLVMDGFRYWFKEASCVTVHSAPNHMQRVGN